MLNPVGDQVFARVIVGTDGSERALQAVPIATQAAERFGCPVELVHVAADEDTADQDATGVRVVQAGDPAGGLVDLASATDPAGLLCLSSRGRRALGEAVFGSVTSGVLRTLHAPLLVVGPSVRPSLRPWRRILVCLDGSARAATIVPPVTAWAHHLDLEVELVHVSYPLGDPRSDYLQVPDEERSAVEQLRAAATQLEAAGVSVRWSVIEHTLAAEGITQNADHSLSDVIALATHGRTGLARLIAGSVALDVVRHATVPVLTLRPEHLR